MTEDEVRDRIRIAAGTSVAAWARDNGFTQSYVAKVLRGEQAVSKALAKAVGYQRQVFFSPCDHEAPSA